MTKEQKKINKFLKSNRTPNSEYAKNISSVGSFINDLNKFLNDEKNKE